MNGPIVTQVDVLIIGCGIGGAAAALRLAKDRERTILIVTRAADPADANTWYAQGGIIGRGPEDSADMLVEDILRAGAGAALPAAARILAEEGPQLVQDVLVGEAGVAFDRAGSGELSYTREGGHSSRRILHVGDSTGRSIEEALVRRLDELPNVTLQHGVTAVDLITSAHHLPDPLKKYEPVSCLGAYLLNQTTGRIDAVVAQRTILATGGLGRIYTHTTNPKGARGDGVAMATRAGARIVNAEYVQFHPTTLAVPEGKNFLISEAVRGEGARLLTPDGRAFMQEYAPEWGDLAPRDIVARAIHQEMIAHEYPYVLLDLASQMGAAEIRTRFPTIYETCLAVGVDMSEEPIPVVPAAHYFCGGVLTDAWGCTTLQNLYAVGEVSCTGLHGANRLASTSLLEGLVWGHRAGTYIVENWHTTRIPTPPMWREMGGDEPDPVLIRQDMQRIQDTMWHYVGLVRNAARLARASRDLSHLWEEVESFYRKNRVTDELLGLRNAAQTAWVVTQAAWQNRQSRGAHYREDSVETIASQLTDSTRAQWAVGEF